MEEPQKIWVLVPSVTALETLLLGLSQHKEATSAVHVLYDDRQEAKHEEDVLLLEISCSPSFLQEAVKLVHSQYYSAYPAEVPLAMEN